MLTFPRSLRHHRQIVEMAGLRPPIRGSAFAASVSISRSSWSASIAIAITSFRADEMVAWIWRQ